jgi:coenzyme F420 hydrogenase subunit beta
MSRQGSPTVERVLRAQLCTGCGLCASVSRGAIRMETVAPGYSRPTNDRPVDGGAERAIANACPGAKVSTWGDAPNRHPYWGPWRTVATGYANDGAVRHRASSGGAITALAVHALRSGLVDRVIHVMPDPAYPTRNIVVCSTGEQEVVEGAGSRYASSSPLADIDRILSDGGRLAFIGKPCDVSALRRLGQTDGRVADHVALALSFFCAGVPSHNAAGRILADLGVAPEEVEAFRYRGFGWPGMARATLRDGRHAEMTYEESWGGRLSHEVQYRCKICPDAVGGAADIACADAWYGGETGYPTFEELDGRSLIMTRTAVGDSFLGQAVAAGALSIEPLDIGEIDLMQPSQARRKRQVKSRIAALHVTMQPSPEMRGVMVDEAATRAGPVETARSFLGSVRRILIRRR